MNFCKHCDTRVEPIQHAGIGTVWMHLVDNNVPGTGRYSTYLECGLPRLHAEPSMIGAR
jgi:hypothetical protein